jgi:inward rectifier potassium channel
MTEQTSDKIYQTNALAREETRDLGFGSVVARESRQRLLNTDGSFNVQRTGLNFITSLSLYHTFLTMSWATFLLLVLLLYFLSNILFGLIYAFMGAEAIVDTSIMPTENLLLRGFFFSVQTFATIGYGTIHPVGVIPNLLVTIESYYSMIVTALVTGIVFARFSRPTARIKFSKKAVVAPYQNGKGFMFRLVNMRSSQLIDVSAQVLFSRFVKEDEATIRRFDVLDLERRMVSFLPLAWTVVHSINEASPLYGLTHEDLEKSDAEILILLTAIDEGFAQTVHTRTSYKPEEIVWNAKFVNLYNEMNADEPISIDIRKLSQIEKVSRELHP